MPVRASDPCRKPTINPNTIVNKLKLSSYGIAVTCLVIARVGRALGADLEVPVDYPTIQAAVDAANSGDAILIASGVYVEQTTISNKNLTLIGRPGTILRAFPGMSPAMPGEVEARCILFISKSPNVIIQDLNFEGDQLADQNAPGLIGVDFDISGGSVENCRFTGFREKMPGAMFGSAIKFWNGHSGASLYEANVTGTTIVDSYSGIEIYGAPEVISYDLTVVDNTITGVGMTTADDLLQGLHLGDGTVGKVARNTISGFSYDGPVGPGFHPIPFGILRLSSGFPANTLALEPMTFEGNVLRQNQVHLAFFKADNSVVTNNTFDANPPGLEVTDGLWFSGTNVQVIGNQFRNMPEGIRLAGIGDPLGNATDATLIDNLFCNVTTPINLQPQATATEQGTLLCPFPDPVLDIASAVLLSWPEINEGFVVESALALDGPWSVVEATLFLQDGRHSASVPTAGEQQFFRLARP